MKRKNDSKIYSYAIKADDKNTHLLLDIIREFQRCLKIKEGSYRIFEKWTNNGYYVISFEYFNMWMGGEK